MQSELSIKVREFLQECGYDERKLNTIGNVVNSFSNPKRVADIVSFRFPRLLGISAITDTNSISAKLEQWKALNVILAILGCELLDRRIDRIDLEASISKNVFSYVAFAEKLYSKDQIFKFLLLLKVKMDEYMIVYLKKYGSFKQYRESKSLSPSKSIALASNQSTTQSPDSHKSISNKMTLDELNNSSMATIHEFSQLNVSNSPSTLKAYTPSKSMTMKYKPESEPIMSESEIALKFESYCKALRESLDKVANEANILEEKSLKLEEKFEEIASTNKDELYRTTMRLKTLHYELETFHSSTSMDTSLMAYCLTSNLIKSKK